MEFCDLKIVGRAGSSRFLEHSPEASMHAPGCAAQEYRSGFDEACRLALPSTSAGPLATLFLEWNDAREREGDPLNASPVSLTHEELAGRTATTRETVTRTLAKFKRDGVFSIKGVSLTILQPRALEELSP